MSAAKKQKTSDEKTTARLEELKKNGDVIGLCVSGGLDSKSVAHRLVSAGIKVICFCGDLGQPDETDINDVIKKMEPCGCETVIVDLRNEMAEGCFQAIMAQAKYDGGYWQSTGIGRWVTVAGLLKAMQAKGVTTLGHGATGAAPHPLSSGRSSLPANCLAGS